MREPPTEKQLAFLKRLKYDGPVPRTKEEASWLIDARKDGKKSEALSAGLLKGRKREVKDWIAEQRRYKKDSLQQAKESCGAIAGFRLANSIQCPVMRNCAGAFLPIQVAQKWPDLLPPGRKCVPESCDSSCEFEEVMEDEVLSRDTPMIVRPGKIVAVGSHHKPVKLTRVIVLALIVIVALYWLVWRH